MECNNEYCTWCTFGQCCHESEEGHKNAIPNQLDCPSALRSDFEEEFVKCYKRVSRKITTLNFDQMYEVEKFLNAIK